MAKHIISLLIIALLPLLLVAQKEKKGTETWPLIRENVILHTDRDIYFAGEKIWFSATRTINNKLTDKVFSKILYVELCDLGKVQHVLGKNTIDNNGADGVIDIPEDLATGYYVLRAYTNYQRNEGPESFATRMLVIVNPSIPPIISGINTDNTPEIFVMQDADSDIYRYGMLLPGKYALSRNISLHLDREGLVYPVRHFPNGLAYFQTDTLLSGSMAELRMIIHHDTLVEKLILPQFPAVSLNVTTKGKSLEFKALKNTEDLSFRGNLVLSILDESFQKVLQEQIALQKKVTKWSVSTYGLSPGLYFAMLSDEVGDTLSYTAFYQSHASGSPVQVRTGANSYGKREKAKVDIDFGKAYTDIAHFDVSVVKKGSTYAEDNLPDFLIRNPHLLEGYMSNNPPENKILTEQIEVLLSAYAHQVRKTKNEAGTPVGSEDTYYVETRGVKLSGLVQNKSTGKPAANATVYMSLFGDQPQLQIYTTAEDGIFRFALRHVNDLVNVYLVAKNDSLTELNILVSADHDVRFPEYYSTVFIPDSTLMGFLDEAYINAQVEENYFHSLSKNTPFHHSFRFNEPEVLIDFDDFIEMEDMEASLNEIVPYVKVKRRNRKPYLEVLDGITNLPYDNPLVLLDNLPVFDMEELLSIHPSRIKTVAVINSTYIYGDQALKGVVLISTKTDNFGGYALPGSFATIEYQTAASPVSFVQPYDSTRAGSNDRFPDFRNTLFRTTSGKPENPVSHFTFFTSDHIGTYEVIVQGITSEGSIFRASAEFSVK